MQRVSSTLPIIYDAGLIMKVKAKLYDQLNGKVNCKVCQHRCIVSPGRRGFCGTRENIDKDFYSIIYAAASSVAVDPIEKKPLFHFYPGSTILSLGTVGCNFRCKYCQNWNISQKTLEEINTQEILPEKAIQLTMENRCKSIAWTYNEPTIWLEYTYDCARIAHKENIKTVYVTNGYMTPETLELIGPHLDAANVDLKSMSNEFYKELCGARLEPVLENIIWMYENNIHLEVTNLLIPGYNDSEEDIQALVKFMAEEVGVEVPLHFTRFFPHYQLNQVPPTDLKVMDMAYDLAKKAGLRYVYLGNVSDSTKQSTYCYDCGEPIIMRDGYQIKMNLEKNKKCSSCGTKIDIQI